MELALVSWRRLWKQRFRSKSPKPNFRRETVDTMKVDSCENSHTESESRARHFEVDYNRSGLYGNSLKKLKLLVCYPLLLVQADPGCSPSARPLPSKGPSEATRDQNPDALRAQAPLSHCASQADRTVFRSIRRTLPREARHLWHLHRSMGVRAHMSAAVVLGVCLHISSSSAASSSF